MASGFLGVRVQGSGLKGLGYTVENAAFQSWGFKASHYITPVGTNEATHDVDIRHYSAHHPPQQ